MKQLIARTLGSGRRIVKTGQLSNAEAEAYLVKILIARRDKIGRVWLPRLTSFDDFSIDGDEFRFEHLASQYGFAPRPDQHVAWLFSIRLEARGSRSMQVRG